MQYKDAGKPAPQVEIEAGGYLLEMLHEIGPIKAMPMGGVDAITWGDLYPYIRLTQGVIDEWEARLLIDMAKAFAAGFNEGKSPFSIAPMDRDINRE